MAVRSLLIATCVLAGGAVHVLLPASARGDARADRALGAAIKRGEAIWRQTWGSGTKSCAECHDQGPNKMRGSRLKAFPRYDKAFGKVVTGQQKLNQMIKDKGVGTPLELGSDELNALEAYVGSLP